MELKDIAIAGVPLAAMFLPKLIGLKPLAILAIEKVKCVDKFKARAHVKNVGDVPITVDIKLYAYKMPEVHPGITIGEELSVTIDPGMTYLGVWQEEHVHETLVDGDHDCLVIVYEAGTTTELTRKWYHELTGSYAWIVRAPAIAVEVTGIEVG